MPGVLFFIILYIELHSKCCNNYFKTIKCKGVIDYKNMIKIYNLICVLFNFHIKETINTKAEYILDAS